MLQVTPLQMDQIRAHCRRLGVSRLDLCGSATGDEFDPDRSDADFLVEFAPGDPLLADDRYFDLHQALERILNRPVDLLMAGAVQNRYLARRLEQQRLLLYAA